MKNNCEHIVALEYYGNSGDIVTEKEIADFILGRIDDEVANPSIQSTIDFGAKDIYSVDWLYELFLFDYCPCCGCKLDTDRIEERLNRAVTDKMASIDKALYLKRVGEKVKSIRGCLTVPKDKRATSVGYVYLVKMGNDYKIGISKTPSKRLGEFTKLPNELEQICVVKVKGYKQVEDDLHKIFVNKCKRGEWFELNEEDIEYIKEYLKEYEVE